MFDKLPSISRTWLIHLVTLFLVVFYNVALFRQFFVAYPVSAVHLVYMLSVALVLAASIELILHFICFGKSARFVLIAVLMLSSAASFFMNTYGTVLDASMLDNIFQTDAREAGSLINFKLVFYLLFLGVLPSVLVYKIKIDSRSLKVEFLSSAKIILLAFAVVVLQVMMFSSFYSSFIRKHKEIRVYANPTMYIYSVFDFVNQYLIPHENKFVALGEDAAVPATDEKRELVIVVVGETARAENFSLNGYVRKTNPLLEKEQVYSFRHFQSCGTSTAISVPCMFSHLDSGNFTVQKGKQEENLLDVLHHAGVNVLWRDNNSDSKDVAVRVAYEDFKSNKRNPACDIECRDIGMLSGLQDYIDSKPEGDMIIVLHQMGNHGPDYYNRYPPDFEKFKPACHSDLLENCSEEQIVNAYDNAILYTDYFLSEVIKLLKTNTEKFETSMVYVSDHGESLGESGVYLHGLPNFMAPNVQRDVGVIFWLGDSVKDVDKSVLPQKTQNKYSHDQLFHTILGLFEIKTSVYNPKMDILDHIE